MISELDKVLNKNTGIACIDSDSTLSPFFLYLHFVDNYLKSGGNVVFISTHSSLNTLKLVLIFVNVKVMHYLMYI